MSEVKTTRYGKGSEMDGVATRLHQLLSQHEEKLKNEGLEEELEIITDYVEKCCAGKLEYALLLDAIGLDVLKKASEQLKVTAQNRQDRKAKNTETLPDKTTETSNYCAAINEISSIIDDLLKSDELANAQSMT